jgi:glucose-1-phosphate adenylyltransferase
MGGVVTVILGGGRGTRLFPLTAHRAKPAVPFGGKFRLIDIPISNSLHAGLSRIYVITQYASASLHRHIAETYRFDHFNEGAVDILAAEESIDSRSWYEGTADAVRRNLTYLMEREPEGVLVLSGDQLYLMDVRGMVRLNEDTEADFTIAVKPVPRSQARELGIMRVDRSGRIVAFVEKPQEDAVLDEFALDAETIAHLGFDVPPGHLLASMGIYMFRADALCELLSHPGKDFGKEIIPGAIASKRVMAFPHTGYWEDIGTIEAFHRASIEMTLPWPPLNLYSRDRPIYTNPRFLPGTKINRCQVEQAILCEGSILSDSTVCRSIVGIRAIVREGAVISDSVIMGARYYEATTPPSGVGLGIGRKCEIRRAIVDLDARIGDGVKIVNKDNVQEFRGENWSICNGIVVVARGAVIPPGTTI